MEKRKKFLIVLLLVLLILPIGFSIANKNEKKEVGVAKEKMNVLKSEPENAPKDFGPVPNQTQLDYYDQELSAFMHYGPNTFTGLEWGNESYTINSFQGKEFHAKDMVKVLKDTGFKRLIITAKHHDGFVLYKSAFTDFDIESSTYKGDILKELSEACSEQGLDMGLYLSPWDIHEPSYGYGRFGGPNDDKNGDYNEYYINQIREINKNDDYGRDGQFVEWWMDGAKGQGEDAQEYDFPEILQTIREDNDEMLIFGAILNRGGVHWVGNERGFADVDSQDPTVPGDRRTESEQKVGPKHLQTDENGEVYWSVPEADVSITSGWFWAPNRRTVKSMDDLANIYFNSVGHGVPLLLNMAPNRNGNYDKEMSDRLYEFKDNIDKTFSNNLLLDEGVTIKASNTRDNSGNFNPENVLDEDDKTYWTTQDGVNEASLEINLGGSREFDVVSIEEFIEKGLRIYEFDVQYKNGNQDWMKFGEGRAIGAKRLLRRSPVLADKIKINIKAKAVPIIDSVGVYKASEGFEIKGSVPTGLNVVEDEEFQLTGSWGKDSGPEYTNNSAIWSSDPNGVLSTSFIGSKFYVLGTIDPGHGLMEVTIDGEKQEQVNTNGSPRRIQQIIFTSKDLENKEHTIEIRPITKAIGVDCIYYLNNGGRGMFEIENTSYTVNEKDNSITPLKVKIMRVGGSNGRAEVTVTTPPGSAVQGQYYVDVSETLVFEDGETEKYVDIKTIDNSSADGDKDFYIQLSNPKDGILGFNKKVKVLLVDDDIQGQGNDLVIGKDEVKIEAEDFILEPRVLGQEPDSNNKNIRITEDSECSGGKKVSWFETGNKMYKEFEVEEAGTYTVKMVYQSGRPTDDSNNNTMNVKEGVNVEDMSVQVKGGGNSVPWMTSEFDIVITNKGKVTLRFVADSKSSPNIDYFTIKRK